MSDLSEQDIQRQILDALPLWLPGAFIRKLPVSGMRVGGGRVAKSPLAGMPDILAIWKGRYLGLEVKRPGEKPSLLQEIVGRDIQAADGYVDVVWDLDTAEATVSLFKLRIEGRAK